MSDHTLRTLERRASAGDIDAAADLAARRVRLGRCAWCAGPPDEDGDCCCYGCFLAHMKAGTVRTTDYACSNCPRPDGRHKPDCGCEACAEDA